ncbi:hypothetical protein AXX12_00615 [Anaerosporomusa subterranea]|uniref:Outer membrane protein beta-barrel domain-containing protein n=1 Tax=Anaerosporomusa subterranea TaxID=1794912 RepID=A0A154BVW4_ANASB|nr:hypothetical protein [Anaerosporomusa subterranea]KYZ78082.1 hypothetical protein AXX12_00615 [Anaerosporomusa subterranea]
MKKLTLLLAGLLAFNVGVAAAAPLNELNTHQTAVGIMMHSTDPDSDTIYIEHKLSPKFTVGLQTVDWGNHGDADDIYGQLHLTDNLRAIAGVRDFGSSSELFLGLGVSGPLSAQWNGFASFAASSEHKELHVGANYAISHNVDLTVSYLSVKPDGGSSRNGLGLGAAFKF